MMMMDREWELDWAIRAYHAIDLSASETGGRKTQVYMVEDDASSYQGDETEDAATVLVSLAEFGINDASGADDQISMTEDDYEVFLLDLIKGDMTYEDFPAFVVQQVQNKLRTWTQNKDLKRKMKRDRDWIRSRVEKMTTTNEGKPEARQ